MSTPLNGSLIKALEILDLFSDVTTEISAKDVAQRLDMNVATAHRFLLTLEHTGCLVSPRRSQFTLGEKLEELGRLAFEINPLPSLSRPVIESISRELNESAMACRLGRSGPVCIASANSRRPIRFSVDIGAALPITVTAQGKLFLAKMDRKKRTEMAQAEALQNGVPFDPKRFEKLEADLEKIGEQGFATNFGENEAEVAAVAVPVIDEAGRTPLTLSVFGIRSRFDDELIERVKLELFKGAAILGQKIRDRSRSRLELRAS